MHMELERVLPNEIEKRSMEIITSELPHPIDEKVADVVRRVIHTTADFDYARNLAFSPQAVELGLAALKAGATVVTDTQMAKAGINKRKLAQLGGEVFCFISDEDVAQKAKEQGSTRATASMEKAAALNRPLIFAIGNAPTALVKLY